MLTPRGLTELYRHMEWADARLWRAIRDLGADPLDSRLFDLLYHLSATQWAFLQMGQGRPRAVPEPGAFPTRETLEAWARAYHVEAGLWLGGLRDASLAEPFVVPWSQRLEDLIGAAPPPATFGEALVHVALHSAYHRAQANTRLREIGATPPIVDFILWIWLGHPVAEW